MSHDLFFTKPRIPIEDFVGHFAGRAGYELANGQAFYRNEDTGVYFSFQHFGTEAGRAEETEHSASFNLNYCRPNFFGLEAVSEVLDFVQRFQFSVHDPQGRDWEVGSFSEDAFLESWDRANAGACKMLMLREDPSRVWSLPKQQLEAIWRWNLNRQKRESELPEDVGVPKVVLGIHEGRIGSVALWPDGVPGLIPEVDFLVAVRVALAPRKLFRGRIKDRCIIPIGAARSVLAPYGSTAHSLAAFRIDGPESPQAVLDFIRSLEPATTVPKFVPFDQVLDSELVGRLT